MRRFLVFLGALIFLSGGSASAADVSRLEGLLFKSREAWTTVKDYHAVFLKQELADGALGPKETIFLKFEKPFKIFMHWMDTDKKGLQVLYERGRHDGKLAIHKPGLLLGLAPVVFLEQSSPWVREGSESYDIEDAGIGTFLEDFSNMTQKGVQENKIQATFSETESGTLADVSFPGSVSDDTYFASRVEVFFEEKTGLPVRMTLYDWEGSVTGIYEYDDLRLNVGTDDAEFRRLAHKKLQKLFLPPVKVVQKTNFSSR